MNNNRFSNKERSMSSSKVNGICGICNASCGISLHIENDKLIKVEGQKDHPITKGFICVKAKALPEILNAPDRLDQPLVRDNRGNLNKISWDTAFEIIVEKLEEIRDKYGAESLAMHTGQTGVRKEFPFYVERFCNAYGTPNFSTAGSHCHRSKDLANRVTIGALPLADYKSSRCIVLWGYNPMNSCPAQMVDINKSIANGAKLVVIDPQETALAKRADIHLQLRPGTDGALVLGMLHVIIKEKLFDEGFVKDWTIGFEEIAELVKIYTPKEIEKITNVSAELIVEAARLYASTAPASISQGISVELQTNGFQTARAIATLQAITGNLDKKGGAIFTAPAPLTSLKITRDSSSEKPIGYEEFPLFCKTYGQAQANIYSKAILEETPYPIKALIVIGSNPILTWPNSNILKKAIKGLDFMVVMDHFMTETAKQADLVIPAATFFERNEFWDGAYMFGIQMIGFAPKILNNKSTISEWEFISQLAKRLGLNEYFTWKNELMAMEYRLKNLDITLKDIEQQPYRYSSFKEKKYEEVGFNTQSGKVEIYSQYLKNYGYDPLPVYYEPSESPLATPELLTEYPLVLSSGARYLEYYHSRYRNIKYLTEHCDESEALIKINPQTARELDICDGENVCVQSSRGSITLKTCIVDTVDYNTVFIPHGWEEANANELTDNIALDPVSGFPSDRALLAKIIKLSSD